MKKVKLNNKYKSTALLNGKNSQKTNIDKKWDIYFPNK